MFVQVDREIPFDSSATWNLIENYGNLDWIPGVKAVKMNGKMRVVTFVDDSTANEEVLACDSAKREFVYGYVSGPLPVKKYIATISVSDSGTTGRSKVSWATDFEVREGSDPDRMVRLLQRAYGSALEKLEITLTAQPRS